MEGSGSCEKVGERLRNSHSDIEWDSKLEMEIKRHRNVM